MDLFSSELKPTVNILPCDGEVHYYGNAIHPNEANGFFDKLLNEIAWQQDEVQIYGKHIVTKRKVAWYGDEDFNYTYSNRTKKALPWNDTLRELKKLAENICQEPFNACLLNLYHNGSEGMGWHSDAEKELKTNAGIASMSFGACRKFVFKHKQSKETVSIYLENGSLLHMKAGTQAHWLHSLPVTKKVFQPRINLTFRTMDCLK
jgi:alkylated DNA repair dioxygenase AlkB